MALLDVSAVPEHLHREITLEQHWLSGPASLFVSSWFGVQEVAELQVLSHQHQPRAPLLLDLATRSPGAAPPHSKQPLTKQEGAAALPGEILCLGKCIPSVWGQHE